MTDKLLPVDIEVMNSLKQRGLIREHIEMKNKYWGWRKKQRKQDKREMNNIRNKIWRMKNLDKVKEQRRRAYEKIRGDGFRFRKKIMHNYCIHINNQSIYISIFGTKTGKVETDYFIGS